MNNKLLPLAVALLALCSSPGRATVPAPLPLHYSQPDGTKLTLFKKGRFGRYWYQDQAGHAVVLDGDTWTYARLEQGRLIGTGIPAHRPAPTWAIRHYRPPVTSGLELPPGEESSPLPSQGPLRAARALSPQPDNVPVLTLLVDFADVQIQYDFAALLWADTASLRHYYRAQSLGQVELSPAGESQGNANDGLVSVHLELPHPDCGGDCSYGIEGVLEAALAAADPHVDFARFDKDGDGALEPEELALLFVFAGFENSYDDGAPGIWAHRWVMPASHHDGVSLRDYLVIGERHGDHQATLGILAHELGHLLLALPDLYADEPSAGLGRWALMASGSWNRATGDTEMGQTPSGFSAWSRLQAGWQQAQLIEAEGNLSLAQGQIQRIYVDPYLRERRLGNSLLLTLRGFEGYDRSLPGRGLLITESDPRQIGNADPARPLVKVVAADGRDDLAGGSNLGDGGDIWPGNSGNRTLAEPLADSPVTLDAISDAQQPMQYGLALNDNHRTALLNHGYGHQRQLLDDALLWGLENLEADRLEGLDFFLPRAGQVRFSLHQWLPDNGPGEPLAELASFQGEAGWHRLMLEQPLIMPARSLLQMRSDSGFAYEPTGPGTNQWTAGGQPLAGAAQLSLLLAGSANSSLVARDDSLTMAEDELLIVSPAQLLGNDNPGYQELVLGQASHGRVELRQEQIHFIPEAHYFGQASFQYRLRDAQGLLSAPATVWIQVQPVNDAPTLNLTGTRTLAGAGELRITADARDADGDALDYRWQQLTGPSLAGLSEAGREFSLELPAPDQTTSYGFRVRVTDPQGLSQSRDFSFEHRPAAIAQESGGGGSLGWLGLGLLALVRRKRC
ncbi:M6 family metalloprotease domain-containing protein [Gallaecimonas sp. GXIMD4217]|uniref:M6 family metalloprotease domain-containing protein n=1 Tax=Gallaecimonas sp. GXIMD4217 TaxID=3131927 RepID=UPI00311AF8AE